jgi:hypothetical protein
MSNRRLISIAAVAALGVAWASADAAARAVAYHGGAVAHRGGAVAYHGGAVGYHGGAVGYRGGVYGGNYYRPGVGLAAGAVVGGAIAASQPWGYGGYGYGGYGYDNGYYGSNPGYSTSYYPGNYQAQGGQDAAAYCAQRFRSYDPGSGTYLGHDGQRHPCP